MKTSVALAIPLAMVAFGAPLMVSFAFFHLGYIVLALLTLAGAGSLIAGLRRNKVRRPVKMLVAGASGIAWTSALLVVWTFAAANYYNASESDPYHQSDPMLVVFPVLVPLAYGISGLAVAVGLAWTLVADHRR